MNRLQSCPALEQLAADLSGRLKLSSSQIRTLIPVAFAVGLSIATSVSRCRAAELTSPQQEILKQLDSQSIEKLGELISKAEQYRTQFDQIKKAFQDGSSTGDVDDVLVEFARQLSKDVPPNAMASIAMTEPGRQLKAVFEKVERELQLLEQTVQSDISAITNELPLSADEARRELQEMAQAECDAALLKIFDEDLFAAIAIVRDPVTYARDFIKGELESWFREPRTHETVGGFRFTIRRPDGNYSIFDPKGGLVLVVDYPAIPGTKVEASGLYFEYVPGQALPRPDLSKIQIRSGWESAIRGQVLKSLGEDLTADLNLPIKIRNVELIGFTAPRSDQAGAINLDMEIKFAGDNLPGITGGATIRPYEMRVDLRELKASAPAMPPIPLGSTPFAMYGYEIGFNPRRGEQKITLGTDISTVAASKDLLKLGAKFEIPLPVRGLNFNGKMSTANQLTFADVNGYLDFAKPELAGDFHIPPKENPLPIGDLFREEGKFQLNREGFFAEGKAHLFGAEIAKAELQVLNDGSAHFNALAELNLLAGKLSAQLTAQMEKGFQRLQAEFVAKVQVEFEYLQLVDVIVSVHADTRPTNRDLPIRVTLDAWGARMVVDLPSLTALDLALIVDQLLKQLPKIIELVSRELARAEKETGKWAADQEKKFKNWVYENAAAHGLDKVSVDGGGPIDKCLGDISAEGKRFGEELTKSRERAGRFATEFREKPLDTAFGAIANLPGDISNLGSALSDAVSDFGSSIGIGGGKKKKKGPSQAEIDQQKRAVFADAFINARFEKVLPVVEAFKLERGGKPKIYNGVGKQVGSWSGLSMLFRSCVATRYRDDPHDAALLFLIVVDGFSAKIVEAHRQNIEVGSDAKNAMVVFTGVTPEVVRHSPEEVAAQLKPLTNFGIDISKFVDAAKANIPKPYAPKARINIPEINEKSTFGGRALAYEEIQKILEQYFPEVEIEGARFHYEKNLVLENTTSESLTIWVQAEKRGVHPQTRQFMWQWAPAKPVRIVLAPKQRLAVKHKDFDMIAKPSPPLMGGELDRVMQAALESQKTLQGADRVHGRRIRLWAESDSGRTWTQFRDEPKWIVDSTTGGERKYVAASRKDYVHQILEDNTPRTWQERQISVSNNTNKSLKVRAQAYSNSLEKGDQWVPAQVVTIEPNKAVWLVTSSRRKLRGSKLKIWAEDVKQDFYRWDANKEQPLQLVDPVGYRRTAIGEYRFMFDRNSVP